jgi:hypothetical protein
MQKKPPLPRSVPTKRKPKPEPIVLCITVDASDLVAAIKAALAAMDEAKVKIASAGPSAEPNTTGLFELRGGGGRP